MYASKIRFHMLSVIIPAYNEEASIAKTVTDLVRGLEKHQVTPYEVLVVSDGSTDDTARIVRDLKLSNVRVDEYARNQGKGHALTHGVKHSKGETVTFFDAGGDFDPFHIKQFLQLMEIFDADIVIGSKRHPASVLNYPLRRQVLSNLYYYLIRILFNLNVRDTQSGLKLFRREVLEKVLPRALVKRYAIDVELLVIAKHLGFKRIFEAPVRLNYNFAHTSINYGSGLHAVWDTFAIWYRLHILHWYDRPHVKIRD